jgi:sulfite exporter TauE/SafE
MDAALILSAGLMGVASMPHCAAMCGAPCAAIVGQGTGPRSNALVFHAARVASYAAAGAIAAGGVGGLASLGRNALWLQPLWVLLHAAALAFGGWLVVRGRAPVFAASGSASLRFVPGGSSLQAPRRGRARAATSGALWAAWPCGVLQSTLLVAALASGPAGGAAVMATFAASSGAGLWLAPVLWRRIATGRARPWLARLAGALLMAASAWGLIHALGPRVAAWCAA